MNRIIKSIHGSKKVDKTAIDMAFDRFVKQTQNRNIFYIVLNGIAMPVATSPRA